MSRILSRRADGAPTSASNGTDVPPADQPTVVVPAHSDGQIAPPPEVVEGAEQPTAVVPALEGEPVAAEHETVVAPEGREAAAVPEGEPVPPRASFRNRSRLRRRLRYLRRVREIGFRDLGGLVFDLDRFGRERPDLVEMKLQGLKAIDAELRALEVALDDVRDFEELHEPGVSACAHCGTLHGSESRFCPSCGTPVDAPPVSAVELPAAAPHPPAEEPATEEPAVSEEPALAGEPAAVEEPAAEEPVATDPETAEQPPAADAPAATDPPAAEDATEPRQPAA